MTRALSLVALAAALSLAACDILGGMADPVDSATTFVRFLEPVNGRVDLSLHSDEAGRSAYAIFTTGAVDGNPVPVASSSSVVRTAAPVVADRNQGVAEAASEARRAKFKESLATYQPALLRSLDSTGTPAEDAAGTGTNDFLVWLSNTTVGSVPATCRFASGAVDFGDRVRSLSIWVANDCWFPGGSKTNLVKQEMVDALAAKYFGDAGTRSSSVYAWVTNMLGDEWGACTSFQYGGSTYPTIGESDNVTILLADIYEQNAENGGVVGYFYSGDLISGVAYSNERVMFAIDAVMYANPSNDGSDGNAVWASTDYWPSTVVSTLAHEFQHMIHFYQKGVVAGADLAHESTWVDEMCSMQVEDLLSDKLGVSGPRGVYPFDMTAGSAGNIAGRLPYFIYYPDLSLEDWGGVDILASYSLAYSFGAYLTRNYGGPEFIRRIVHSPDPAAACLADAAASYSRVSESIVSLLRRWGAAVLLSAGTDAPEYYRYNSGGAFPSTVGGVEYSLGSINMYNYKITVDDVVDWDLTWPYVFSSSTIGSMSGGAYSNAFMHLGDPSENPAWTLEIPDGMYATIIID